MTDSPLGGLPADEVNTLDEQSLPAEPFTVDEGRVELAPGESVLTGKDLRVEFPTDGGTVKAVSGGNLDARVGETLGRGGESGSGKRVTSMSILGLLPKSAKITGSIDFRGTELLTLDEKKLRKIRGAKIAMVFQDALAALNPVFTVGDQIAEAI